VRILFIIKTGSTVKIPENKEVDLVINDLNNKTYHIDYDKKLYFEDNTISDINYLPNVFNR